ncbi:MAG TPA: FecR family protein [Polyangia bacterium]
MSDTQLPLKDHLVDPVDDAAIHRIGERIDERLRRPRPRRLLPLALVGATAVAAVTVAAWRIHRDAGPLRFADGRELVAMDAVTTAGEFALSDGSRIRLSPGAHFEPLESSGTTFSAIVTQGRADFEVRPGGPRHWVIECGLATVEVIGTSFSCDRETGRLRLVVRHGAVLVRGERVPNRARRLLAGESLELAEDARRPAPSSDDAFAMPALPPPASASGSPAAEPLANLAKDGARGRMATTRNWRDLARRGRHGEAFSTLGTEGLRRESKRLGVNDLFALADVARLSGHPADAVVPLDRILTDFANDARAPLAAFALGRLELDSLGQAQAAATAFRKALALGIPSGLREDVRARLVEAYVRSGDAGAARRAADAYVDEFPNGRHLQAIQGWLRPP